MKNKKTWISFLCLVMSFGMIVQPCLTVYAKDKEHTKTLTFATDNSHERRDEEFQQEITVDGAKYKLTDITYEVIQVNEKEDKVIENEPIAYGGEDYKPLEEIIENGITYKLKQSTGTEVVVEDAYSQSVSGYSEYDHQVSTNDVPATKDITVKNEKTGEEVVVTCKLQNVTTVDAGWKNTYIDIVFETYNAYVFNWNGIQVTSDSKKPLAGYEKELLESVGANTTDYKVTNTYWTSDAYTNTNGVLCRNARADVQRHSINYRANYVGEIKQEETLGMIFTDTYEYQEGENDHYIMAAVATYEIDQSMTNYMFVGGFLLLIILFVLILYVLSRKYKKRKEN